MSTTESPPAEFPPAARAAVRAGVFGNYVDQINIFLPVVALAPALPTIAGHEAVASTGAYVIMATLIGRPLGAMIFGRIADRMGRTSTTRIAIAGTAACTLGIAAVPTHHAIGWWSIALVIALRFIGGVFLAGEYSAAIPLAMEWSRPRHRGLYSGLIMSMAPWAQSTIAFATALLLWLLGPASYASWGWRVSFAAGAAGSLAMLAYYTTHVQDSHIARRGASIAARTRVGLRDVVFGRYRGGFWQMFGLMSGLWFWTQMVVIVLTARLASDAGLSAGAVAIAMGVASVGQALFMVLAGHVSTRTGRRTLFVGWALVGLVSAPFIWWFTLQQHHIVPAAIGAIALQVVTVSAYGPVGAYLTERFPAPVRSTGYGTAYSLSIVIPALYPYYLPWLSTHLGRQGAVIALLILGGVLVVGCALAGPALRPQEIDDDVETVASRHEPDQVAIGARA